MPDFPERLKKLRKEKDIYQKELADKLNLGRTTIGGYEQGSRSPDKETLNKIADFFDVSTDYLLGRTDHQRPLKDIPGIVPVTNGDMVEIPVIGEIQCGEPVLAVENVIEYRSVRRDSLNGGEYFFLKAKGDSMINIGIQPGSYVLIRQQEDVENGEIAAVLINDMQPETTLKKLFKSDGQLILQSSNPAYDPIIINKGDIRILGKATKVEIDL